MNAKSLTPAHRAKLSNLGVIVTADTNEYDVSQKNHSAFDNCGIRTDRISDGGLWKYLIFCVMPNGDIAITDDEVSSCVDGCDTIELSPATGLAEYDIANPTLSIELTERQRWEAVVSHKGWDGSIDIDWLISNHDIDGAEMAMKEYESQ